MVTLRHTRDIPLARRLPLLAVLALGAAACSVSPGAPLETEEEMSSAALSFTLPHVYASCPAPARKVDVDPSAPELSADEAYFHMWAATVAYGSKEGVERAAKAAGFTYVKFLDPSASARPGTLPVSFQGYVAARSGLTMVVLRGTLTETKDGKADNTDWVINAMDFTRPGWTVGLPGWVHNGYALQVEEGWPFLQQALREVAELPEMRGASQPIMVTGHSLGGALTTLLSVKLAREGHNVRRAVAIAAPRAGDVDFARVASTELGSRFVRIARPDDIVSILPPSLETAELAAEVSAYGKDDSVRREKVAKYRQARFAHLAPPVLLDPETGKLKRLTESEDDEGAEFLRGHLARIKARSDLPKAAAADAEMAKAFQHHGPEAYGCPMGGRTQR